MLLVENRHLQARVLAFAQPEPESLPRASATSRAMQVATFEADKAMFAHDSPKQSLRETQWRLEDTIVASRLPLSQAAIANIT